jgi:RNA polymerase sigma factor (sigma-70 family)
MATTQVGTLLRHIRRLADGPCAPQETDRQLLDDFAARGDEAAFAALVSRHGPMVLRVCRRVLGHEQDAEDAFQATFLVLARATATIRKRDTVGDWLHGVAYRTAMKAKRGAARRRNHEARLGAVAPRAATGPSWEEVQAVLDEEIQRLPPCFRQAFVLCVLEGKGGVEVAAELGCKEGTVKSRVNRARRLLQTQLARRGIHLGALLAALSVAESGRAAVPAALAQSAVRSGLLVVAGGSAAGVIPARVAALATGVTRAMSLTKAKIATAVLLAIGLLAGAGALACRALAAKETEKPSATESVSDPKTEARPAKADPKPQTADDKDSIAYGGRVLGPDGRLVAGAKLYVTLWQGAGSRPEPSPEYATTGGDGRFTFTAPRAKFGEQHTIVAAAAANHGVGWVEVPADGKRDDLTLRLVKDDVPITGQIVDLEGRPIRGAALSVLEIRASTGEDLRPWLEAARDKKREIFDLQHQYLSRFTIALSPKATTDGEGRFRLTGIGRDRAVRVLLEGPGIASQQLYVLTLPGNSIEVTRDKGDPEYGKPRRVVTYYAADFRHVATPTKPIVGVVRDKDSNKPLAGVTVRSHMLDTEVSTTTDAEGRFRLVGMPKGAGYKILAVPGRDQPYVATSEGVPDTPGLGSVAVDFELKRGVWIEGRITDKVTGKLVQAYVEYFSMYSNPHLQRDYPGFIATLNFNFVPTKEDGSYRVVGLPGPGLIVVYHPEFHYLRAPSRDDEYGVKERSLNTAPWAIVIPRNYSAIARIDPAKGADVVKRDVTLDPGWTFTVKVVGPDGKPLAAAWSFGVARERDKTKTAEFTVRAFNPRRPHDILFQHLEKGLVGAAQPPKETGGSVTVRMGPGAAVTGRLVDAGGKPRAGAELEVRFRPKKDPDWYRYHPERVKTDREGRFRLEALLPSYEFGLSDHKGELSFRAPGAGETKDLGDVRLKAEEE